MKIIKESKRENLPIEFITQFVSRSWDEIGNLKSSIEGIKKEFNGTKKVEAILNDLLDAYLIAVGQLESHLDKKDYLSMPEIEEAALKESLLESNEAEAKPIEAKKFEDKNKTEIFTELPDYDVEVEQKGDKVEVEVEPKNANKDVFSFDDFDDSELAMSDEQVARVNEPFDDEWPEPVGGSSDIADAKASLMSGQFAEPFGAQGDMLGAPVKNADEIVAAPKKEVSSLVDSDDAFNFDFEEPEISEEDRENFRASKAGIAG